MVYVVVIALVATLSIFFAETGLFALGPVLFPLPVAVYWALGRQAKALGIVAAAGMAALSVSQTLHVMLFYTGYAVVGIVIGHGFVRRWPFGWCLAATTAAAYSLVALGTLATWDESRAAWYALIQQALRQAEQAADESIEDSPPLAGEHDDSPGGPDTVEPEEAPGPGETHAPGEATGNAALAEARRQAQWLQEHYAAVVLGLWLWPMLLCALAAMALTARLVRANGGTAVPSGGLVFMRVPDWMVWPVIAAALLWMVNHYYHPHETLRVLAWNGAIALAAVYWLQGVAVAVFCLSVLRVQPFMVMLLLVLVFLSPGGHFVICTVGFFDTWVDFRGRLLRWAVARRRANGQDENDV